MVNFILIVLSLAMQLMLMWVIYYQITRTKINFLWIVYSVIISTGSLFILKSYWMIIMLPFFCIYSFINEKKDNWLLISFNGIYTIFISVLLMNLTSMLYYLVVPVTIFNRTRYLLIINSIIFPVVLHTILLKVFKFNFAILKYKDSFIRNKILLPLNVALYGGFSLFLVVYGYENRVSANTPVNEYTKYVFFIYTFMFFSLLIFLTIQMKNYLQKQVQDIKEEQYNQLTLYTQEIEELYQQIRGFRHDFGNMLISMSESINSADVEQIRNVYNKVLLQANIELNQTYYDVAELSNIENTAIKSILSSKIMIANQSGLHISLEIKEKVVFSDMDILDYVRIISVLIDNAIEAGINSEEKKVGIAIFLAEEQLILIVHNSREPGVLTIKNLFDPKFSTKGHDRGTGLYNIQNIIQKYENVTLETQIEDTSLAQRLIIRQVID